MVRGLEQKFVYDTYAPTLHTSSLIFVAIRQLLQEFGINTSIKLYVDNSAAVSIMDNNVIKKSRYFAYPGCCISCPVEFIGEEDIVEV